MAGELDAQIKITAATEGAQKGLEALTKVLEEIKTAASGASGEIDAFEKAGKKISNVGKAFEGVGNSLKQVGKDLSLYLTAPILAFGAIAVKEFINTEKSVVRLNVALSNVGRLTTGASDNLRSYADELARVTEFSGDTIVNSLAIATTFAKTNEQAKLLVKTAADLAAFLGTDLETATKTLGQTLNGNAGILGRTNSAFSKLTEEQLKNGEAIKLVSQLYGGFASESAKTLGGQLTILKNQFNDFASVIGSDIAPAVRKLATYFSEIIASFRGLDDGTRKSIGVFVALAAAIGPVVIAIGSFVTAAGKIASVLGSLVTAIPAIVGFFSGPGGLALALIATGVAVAGLANIFVKLKKAGVDTAVALNLVGKLIAGAFDQKVLPALFRLESKINSVLGKLPGVVGKFYQGIADASAKTGDQLANAGAFDKAIEDIKALGVDAGDAFTFGLKDSFAGLKDSFNEALSDTGKSVADGVKNGTENAKVVLTEFQQFIADQRANINQTIAGNLTDGLLDFAEGTKTAKQAFADFARNTLRYITQLIIQQQIFNALQSSGLFGGPKAGSAGGGGGVGATTGATGGYVSGNKVQRFAEGGAVFGAGSATSDSIPAWLSNGEFVLKASAVRALGVGFLHGLNKVGSKRGRPAFADGGLVGGASGGGPSVIIQNNGSPKEATGSQFDASKQVTTIILEDIQKNGNISKSFQSTFGVKRGGFA